MAKDLSPSPVLSRREREVAALVAEGLTNRAIAARMFISERTVDGHLEHIREKLGVSSRAQVAAWLVAQPALDLATTVVASTTPQPRRPITQLFVAVAAVAVLALVAAIAVPRLFAPGTPAGPGLTIFVGNSAADQLNRPQAVAVAGDGTVYVADTDNFAIKRIDLKQSRTTVFAGGHDGDFVDGSDALLAHIGNPTGVAVAPDGKTVFFANEHMVGRVDPNSTVHLVADRPMLDPVGLASAPDGTLYIADRFGNVVWERSPSGTLRVFAGTGAADFTGDGGPAQDAALDHPRAVAVDSAGDVLIADTGNDRIRIVDHSSNLISTLAGNYDIYDFRGDGGPARLARLSLPRAVAVGPEGNVYVADTGNGRVRRIDRNGIITTVIGSKGELDGPAGLAFWGGDLYVVEVGNGHFDVVRGLASR